MKISPVISEKAMSGNDKRTYTFKVGRSANKIMVKQAVEALYKVTVVDVRTANTAAKQLRRGRSRITGIRPGYKKAVVKLKEGDKITELEG